MTEVEDILFLHIEKVRVIKKDQYMIVSVMKVEDMIVGIQVCSLLFVMNRQNKS